MTERSFPEIGIADVAANIICLEVAEPWVCRSRVDLGPTFTDPAMQQFFGPVRQTLSVRNFLLRDVTLSAQWMLLWKDWCKIAETRNLIPDDVYDGLAIRGEDVAEVTSSAPVVIGFNKDCSGYYHWLVQCLPAIDSAERAQAQPMSLAVPAMTAWQSEYLSLLDCDWAQTIEIEPHREYRLQSAIYSEHLNGSTAWGISQTAIRTFARLRENAAVPPAGEELVYVSRIGSTRRRLLNEDEVIRFLETQGAKIADPGTLTPKEQISLFSGARIVIGPHGGGLTNLVFCRSNAAIYELLPSSYANVCYNRLAQANGMDYWADMFPAESKDDVHDIEWQVDLDVFKRRFFALREADRRKPAQDDGGCGRVSDFDEAGYLASNPDVAAAIEAGFFRSGREHFERFGRSEGRAATGRATQPEPCRQA